MSAADEEKRADEAHLASLPAEQRALITRVRQFIRFTGKSDAHPSIYLPHKDEWVEVDGNTARLYTDALAKVNGHAECLAEACQEAHLMRSVTEGFYIQKRFYREQKLACAPKLLPRTLHASPEQKQVDTKKQEWCYDASFDRFLEARFEEDQIKSIEKYVGDPFIVLKTLKASFETTIDCALKHLSLLRQIGLRVHNLLDVDGLTEEQRQSERKAVELLLSKRMKGPAFLDMNDRLARLTWMLSGTEFDYTKTGDTYTADLQETTADLVTLFTRARARFGCALVTNVLYSE
jgi:hypothetical protein